MASSDFLLASLQTPFSLTYARFSSKQNAPRLAVQVKFAQQDLSSSLLKPASNSCRLNNGRYTASKQVPAVLLTLPSHKVLLPATYVISLLHRSIHSRSSL